MSGTSLAELPSIAALHDAVIFHLPSSIFYPYHPKFWPFDVPPNGHPEPSALPFRSPPSSGPAFGYSQSSCAYCNEAEYAETVVALPLAVIVYHDTTVVEGQDTKTSRAVLHRPSRTL